MNVVILTAGTGSRLSPYTDDTPKSLVKLAGKPLLDYQLSALHSQGLDKIHLVTGYLEEQFEQYPFQRFVNKAFRDSNMVHSLMKAQSLFEQKEDLIISYGDIIYHSDVIKSLLSAPGDIVISADSKWYDLWSLRMDNPMNDAESFIYDDRFNIQELGKPLKSIEQAQAQYIGLIKIKAQCFPAILNEYFLLGNDVTQNMYLTDFIQHLIKQKLDVRASLHQREWLEVDTVEDLHRYEQLIQNNSFDQLGLNRQCFE